MIDLLQWRALIGYFNSRVTCYVDRELTSSTNNVVLLHTVVNVVCDVAVLSTYMYAVTVLLLLICGDIEMNPGPVHKVCPNCNIHIHIKKKSCECGYVFSKKSGRKTGTTRSAGFTVSSGRPWPTSSVTVDLDVYKGRPVSNVDIELNVPMGRPTSNVDTQPDVPMGRPASNVDTEPDVPMGRPTSNVDIELDVPRGHPTSNVNVELDVPTRHPFGAICDATGVLEDNPVLLAEHMKQYSLPSIWDTDKTNLSLSDNLLTRAKKRIGQQVRFDAKPLGIAMCYCCGSILWSRVDNSHTHLVKLDLDDETIPAVAYQCSYHDN